jgi:glycerol kinase
VHLKAARSSCMKLNLTTVDFVLVSSFLHPRDVSNASHTHIFIHRELKVQPQIITYHIFGVLPMFNKSIPLCIS